MIRRKRRWREKGKKVALEYKRKREENKKRKDKGKEDGEGG